MRDSARGGVGGMRRELTDQAEEGGREGVAALRDADDEADDARHVLFDELDLGDERGSDVALPKPTPKRMTPSSSSGTLSPSAVTSVREPASCRA